MKNTFCDISINVLGYMEDEEWVALALEMDLRGYGKTFDGAMDDLFEQVAMQLSFAEYKGALDMALFPAEAVWFQLFAQVRSVQLRDKMARRTMESPDYRVCGMEMPSAHDIDKYKNNFALTGNG